jgi:predicted translin family RNA/ssDNA-binding protein
MTKRQQRLFRELENLRKKTLRVLGELTPQESDNALRLLQDQSWIVDGEADEYDYINGLFDSLGEMLQRD